MFEFTFQPQHTNNRAKGWLSCTQPHTHTVLVVHTRFVTSVAVAVVVVVVVLLLCPRNAGS